MSSSSGALSPFFFKLIAVANLFDRQMRELAAAQTSAAAIDFFHEHRDEIIHAMAEIWQKRYPDETLEALEKRGVTLGVPVIPPPHYLLNVIGGNAAEASVFTPGEQPVKFDTSKLHDFF